MPKPSRDEARPARVGSGTLTEPVRRGEPMDEEDKILENRDDVNMPALLTRDVRGG